MSSNGRKEITDIDLIWGTVSKGGYDFLPEWGQFLVSLGDWIAELDNIDGRIFCTVLLPSRICASAFVAFGVVSNSLKDPSDEISWDTFLNCENGTQVYFLQSGEKNSRRQLEGVLDDITDIGGQLLRKITIDSKRNNSQNLAYLISETKFKDAKVALHPHHRTALLNSLDDLSNKYQNLISPFNENRLLLSQTECMIITNRAAWEREVNDLAFSNSNNEAESSLLTDLLMLSYGRVKLYSPRSKNIVSEKTELTVLDGIDSLRSREKISSSKTLILLDRNEYQEEAEDIIHGFSDYCSVNEPLTISKPKFSCPSGVEIQLYFFPGRAKC